MNDVLREEMCHTKTTIYLESSTMDILGTITHIVTWQYLRRYISLFELKVDTDGIPRKGHSKIL